MGYVRRFTGEEGSFEWQDVSAEDYRGVGARGAAVRWLIGPREKDASFALRYFEVESGGWTPLDSHGHDHGVLILRGKGLVLLGDREVEVSFGDVIYVPPYETHQFRSVGDDPLGFLCVVPPVRDEE